jgi:hypothetical protein
MRNQKAPVDRIVHLRSPIGDPARERHVDIAYRTYVLKALRRFDLETEAGSTRRRRTPASPLLAVDKHAPSNADAHKVGLHPMGKSARPA